MAEEAARLGRDVEPGEIGPLDSLIGESFFRQETLRLVAMPPGFLSAVAIFGYVKETVTEAEQILCKNGLAAEDAPEVARIFRVYDQMLESIEEAVELVAVGRFGRARRRLDFSFKRMLGTAEEIERLLAHVADFSASGPQSVQRVRREWQAPSR